jgi:hypothetical protein
LSSRLPWRKFQDFYLRLGFLKALVAALSHERRSANNDSIIRRLERPLFDAMSAHPALAARAAELFAHSHPRRTSSGKTIESPEVAEASIAVGPGASALYGITKDTAYKILDWGHDVGFVGRANQITERGLVLRSLLPLDQTQRFLSGDVSAWDPFQLDLRERLFFTFHLIETDLLTVELVRNLGTRPRGTTLESRDAAQMTCAALFRILKATEKTSDAQDLIGHRTALELAIAMADEVEADIPPEWGSLAQRVLAMRSQKASARRSVQLQRSAKAPRKTTKNADHQTIPRFEQLVDLGFLSKPDVNVADPSTALAARRRWRYVPTETCRRWARAMGSLHEPSQRLQWFSFAKIAVSASHGRGEEPPPTLDVRMLGERLWNAYTAVGRQVGMSPAESVALRAMLDAAADGIILEMADFHNFLMKVKEGNVLTDSVFFGAGNALDTMFIRLKPSFPAQLSDAVGALHSEYTK